MHVVCRVHDLIDFWCLTPHAAIFQPYHDDQCDVHHYQLKLVTRQHYQIEVVAGQHDQFDFVAGHLQLHLVVVDFQYHLELKLFRNLNLKMCS
jgi:hypothetical protein